MNSSSLLAMRLLCQSSLPPFCAFGESETLRPFTQRFPLCGSLVFHLQRRAPGAQNILGPLKLLRSALVSVFPKSLVFIFTHFTEDDLIEVLYDVKSVVDNLEVWTLLLKRGRKVRIHV